MTATATGGRGGHFTAGTFKVRISIPTPTDSTPPVITPTITGTLGLNGWYKSNVTVAWSVSDEQSTVTTPECTTALIDADTASTTVSCTATSAGGTNTQSVTIKRDATAPTVTPANVTDTTWRNTPLGQEFTASDGGSGLAADQGLDADGKFTLGVSAQSADASTPTTATKTVTDQAGNATTRTVSALIDLGKPTISAATFAADGTTAIGPNANGWFNQTVVVKFTCADGLSDVASCPASVTIASDTPDDGQAVSGAARDNAGNVSDVASITVKVDKTVPTISAAVSPAPNAAGWNTTNPTVTFTCTGGECPAPVVVSTETSGQEVSRTVTDRAGNTASASVTVKLDRTPPSAVLTPSPAQPNGSTGWYTSAITFSTSSSSDALSGLANCTAVAAVTADTDGVTRTTTCTDVAGNSASDSETVKLDQTAPTITATPDRNANSHGWYNNNVTVSFTCTETGSGLAGACPAAQTVSSEGTANISASVADQAGNAATSNSVEVKLDRTAPAISGSDVANTTWRNTPLSANFTAIDESGSGLADPADAAFTLTASAESQNATTPTVSSRTVTDKAGNASTRTLSALIDLTAPTANLAATGTLGLNDWYISDVGFTATGTDGLSGLRECTDPADLTSDSASHTATTTCTDIAGNAAQKSLVVKRDATKPVPQLAAAGTLGDDGWFTGDVTFSTTGSDDATSGLNACTTPGTLTTDSASHEATTTCADKAGNTATKTITVKRDATAPVVSRALSPAANAAGWNNTDVAVDYTCAADLSGVVNCPADTTLATSQTVAALTVRDAAGNGTELAAFSVKIDKVKPTISAATFAADGTTPITPANGWFNQTVVVKFTCADDNSQFGADACPADVTISADTAAAGQSVGGSVTDQAGNASTPASIVVKVDRTAPTISASVSPLANGAGWHNTDPTVTFNCADPLSGVATCTAPQTVTAEGTSTVSGTATDQAGNTATTSVQIKLDKIKPTSSITPSGTLGTGGWYRSAVAFTTAGTDSGSGGVTCSPIATLGADTSGTTVGTTCTDAAGNEQTASLTVKIDQTKPTLTLPGSQTVYPTSNAQISVPFSTSAIDNFTSPQAVVCDKTSPVTVGVTAPVTVTCSATDAAGNVASGSFTFTAKFTFTGFFQPIDMSPAGAVVYNTVKAGSAVPVKFKLGGNQGLNIFAPGFPMATRLPCTSTAPIDDIEETSTATNSGLHYDAAAGQYVYVWKTTASYSAGACYQLTVRLTDGTVQTAFFKFK